VLEAERECKMGLGKRFDNVDDLIAYLLDDWNSFYDFMTYTHKT
jgi:hypothetical protein